MTSRHDEAVHARRTPGAWPRARRLRFAIFLLTALGFAGCEPRKPGDEPNAPDAARADGVAMEALLARYRGRELGSTATEAVPGTGFRAGALDYQAPGDENEYGSIIAVWTADAGKLVWTREHRGDFRPHRLHWMDVDRDGRTDLFFTAGEEDVFETYLFVNRTDRNAGPDSAFALAYRNGNDYTTLLDLDGDGSPELIDSGYPGEEHVEIDACVESPPPPAVRAEAQAEYARRAGAFGAANFTYGYEQFGTWTLHLLDPIRILHVRGGQVRDVTRAYPDHLRWRAGVLEQYRAAASAECRAHIERILDHLRRSGA